jgi:ABC-2 type transport system permease protein
VNDGTGGRGPSKALRRLVSLFRKEMTESFRDWKMLSLTLTFAPFFVLVMYAYLGTSTPVYTIAVVNLDAGAVSADGTQVNEGERFLVALGAVQAESGEAILRVRETEEAEADALLESRRADVVMVVPEGFSESIVAFREGRSFEPVPIQSRGDPGNPDYIMAAVWADMTAMAFVEYASGLESPVTLAAETVSGSDSLTDFELYVPALIILAPMMLMFTAAGALIREKDKGTIIRLRLSNLRVFEWLTAVSLTQVIVGVLAVALTYLTAWGVGYRTNGSLVILLLVAAVTSLSVIAFSVTVAAYLRTVFDLVTVGCFPFFILMFFSGGMFPLPGATLFHLGERAIELNEILPTTHGITALNRVMSFGSGLGDIAYELLAMLILTVAFFAVGTWIFTRRHMPRVG